MKSAMRSEAVLFPSPDAALRKAWLKLRHYWTLIKSLQTGLLLVTAAAGYASGCCLNLTAGSWLAFIGSMFLAVSGSTVVNMVFDRDIDASMQRTTNRPLPSGSILPAEGWVFGGLLIASGLIWAMALDPGYAAVVLVGVALDVVVYTMLLKRRTPFSILIGGLAGGMPVLAGRVLATGRIDWIGICLAVGILLWIPIHILTFSIRNRVDYATAGVPTFVSVYGVTSTRWLITISVVMAAGMVFLAGWQIGLSDGLLALLGTTGALLSLSVILSMAKSNPRLDYFLYKGASVYMLAAMVMIILGGI